MEISIWVATIEQFERIVPSSVHISPNNDILVSAKQQVQKTIEELMHSIKISLLQ